jgi:uncharacterized protein with PIN domain
MPDRVSRFAADAMLGSLARKLRAFGFDTAYFNQGSDEGLIHLAIAEARVILTSDKKLIGRAASKGVPALLIEGRTDGRRIPSLLSAAKAAGIRVERGPPLCSLCNGDLVSVPRENAASRVPASVLRRHRLFLRCTECGHFYWRGGHWKKLSNLERAFGHRA